MPVRPDKRNIHVDVEPLRPYIQATNASRSVAEGPDIDVSGLSVGRGGDTILIFDSGGSPVAECSANSSGLDAATAAATSGDVVWLPAVTITGDHTLGAGIHYVGRSRWATILSGQITMGIGTTMEGLSVVRTANDANALKGVVAAASGTARFHSCHIICTQSGSGDAYAAYSAAGGLLEFWNCYLYGNSTGGSGYGTYRDSGGAICLDGGVCLGSTAPCNE